MAERDYEGMDAADLLVLLRQRDTDNAVLVADNAVLVQTIADRDQTIAQLKWVRALALLCLEEERRPRGAACSASLRRVGPHPHDRL